MDGNDTMTDNYDAMLDIRNGDCGQFLGLRAGVLEGWVSMGIGASQKSYLQGTRILWADESTIWSIVEHMGAAIISSNHLHPTTRVAILSMWEHVVLRELLSFEQ